MFDFINKEHLKRFNVGLRRVIVKDLVDEGLVKEEIYGS